jgi:hypothetical protein
MPMLFSYNFALAFKTAPSTKEDILLEEWLLCSVFAPFCVVGLHFL